MCPPNASAKEESSESSDREMTGQKAGAGANDVKQAFCEASYDGAQNFHSEVEVLPPSDEEHSAQKKRTGRNLKPRKII